MKWSLASGRVAQAARPERYGRAVMADDEDVRIEHPNRGKPASQLARLVVIVLLIASAALVLIVSIGGWTRSRAPSRSSSPTS